MKFRWAILISAVCILSVRGEDQTSAALGGSTLAGLGEGPTPSVDHSTGRGLAVQPTYSCVPGYDLDGSQCIKTAPFEFKCRVPESGKCMKPVLECRPELWVSRDGTKCNKMASRLRCAGRIVRWDLCYKMYPLGYRCPTETPADGDGECLGSSVNARPSAPFCDAGTKHVPTLNVCKTVHSKLPHCEIGEVHRSRECLDYNHQLPITEKCEDEEIDEPRLHLCRSKAAVDKELKCHEGTWVNGDCQTYMKSDPEKVCPEPYKDHASSSGELLSCRHPTEKYDAVAS